jgi:ABC-type phosphate transport system substrate-binding protein
MAALALGASNGAQAQTPINGGGSTLAQPTYNSAFSAYAATIDNSVTFNYAGVGSGGGQRGVLCNDPTNDKDAVGTDIHYGASDATLSAAQIANWNASVNVMSGGGSGCATSGGGTIGLAQGGPLIQVPTFGTPITIPFNLPSPLFKKGSIQLTDTQLCGIFSGKITTWNDPALTNLVASGGTGPALPITVVYRSDGSGTSFLFTSHLAAVCTAANTAAGVTFSGVQTFASLFTTVPSNFVAATGSPGVQAAIGLDAHNSSTGTATGTSGAVGYLSPDYTTIATVNQFQTSTFPPVAAVQNSNNVAAGYVLPTVPNTTLALSAGVPPTTTAQLENPADYVPAIPSPASGYPIAGYTVWILPTCYANATIGFEIDAFLSELYNDANFIGIVQQNGFSPLPTNLLTPINNNILSNNPATNVDIEDAHICQSAGASGAGTYPGR